MLGFIIQLEFLVTHLILRGNWSCVFFWIHQKGQYWFGFSLVCYLLPAFSCSQNSIGLFLMILSVCISPLGTVLHRNILQQVFRDLNYHFYRFSLFEACPLARCCILFFSNSFQGLAYFFSFQYSSQLRSFPVACLFHSLPAQLLLLQDLFGCFFSIVEFKDKSLFLQRLPDGSHLRLLLFVSWSCPESTVLLLLVFTDCYRSIFPSPKNITSHGTYVGHDHQRGANQLI